jgi:uncharacterized protein (TIGR02246 family)
MATAMNAEQGIQLTLNNFKEAWNAHDAKAFAAAFTEDADFTNVFGQNFISRNAIEEQHARIFSTIFKASSITEMKKRIKMISDEIAAVDVNWNMIGAVDMHGNPWPNRKGLLVLVMKRENDNWLILMMHNMDLLQLPSH